MNCTRLHKFWVYSGLSLLLFALMPAAWARGDDLVSCQGITTTQCLELYTKAYSYKVTFKKVMPEAMVTVSFPKNDKFLALANILEAAKLVNYTVATNDAQKAIVVDVQFDGNGQLLPDNDPTGAAAKAADQAASAKRPSDEQLKAMGGQAVPVDLEKCADPAGIPGSCVTLRQIKTMQEQALLKQPDPKAPVLPNDPKSITYEQLKAMHETKIDVPPTGKVTLGVVGESTPTNQQLEAMRQTQVSSDPKASVIPGNEHSITIEQLHRLRDQGKPASLPAGSGS